MIYPRQGQFAYIIYGVLCAANQELIGSCNLSFIYPDLPPFPSIFSRTARLYGYSYKSVLLVYTGCLVIEESMLGLVRKDHFSKQACLCDKWFKFLCRLEEWIFISYLLSNCFIVRRIVRIDRLKWKEIIIVYVEFIRNMCCKQKSSVSIEYRTYVWEFLNFFKRINISIVSKDLFFFSLELADLARKIIQISRIDELLGLNLKDPSFNSGPATRFISYTSS